MHVVFRLSHSTPLLSCGSECTRSEITYSCQAVSKKSSQTFLKISYDMMRADHARLGFKVRRSKLRFTCDVLLEEGSVSNPRKDFLSSYFPFIYILLRFYSLLPLPCYLRLQIHYHGEVFVVFHYIIFLFPFVTSNLSCFLFRVPLINRRSKDISNYLFAIWKSCTPVQYCLQYFSGFVIPKIKYPLRKFPNLNQIFYYVYVHLHKAVKFKTCYLWEIFSMPI
jgi:hypothetical protein